MTKQTSVELIIEEINEQQKRYIDLSKKDKSLKIAVYAILTATTLLKMKCEKVKEREKQQILDAYRSGKINQLENSELYYNKTFNK
jgi:hypothetical protein